MGDRKSRRERLDDATASAKSLYADRIAWLRESVTAPVRARCGLGEHLDTSEVLPWLAVEYERQQRAGDRLPVYAASAQRVVRFDAFTGDGVATRQRLEMLDIRRTSLTDLVHHAESPFSIQPLARVAFAAMAVEQLTLCDPAAATMFVLADVAPGFRVLRIDRLFHGYPSRPATFSVADAWMTAEQIGSLIADRRDRDGTLGGHIAERKRVKRVQKEVDYLVAFVDERRPVPGRSTKNMTWPEIDKDWKRLAPREIQTRVAMDLKKAYWRAVHLREDRGLRPKPDARGGDR